MRVAEQQKPDLMENMLLSTSEVLVKNANLRQVTEQQKEVGQAM